MGTVTVYRLEDKNGTGCFQAASMQLYDDAATAAGIFPQEEMTSRTSTARIGAFPA
jgi:hypothetical protein